MQTIFRLAVISAAVFCLLAQDSDRPKISKLQGVPSEPVPPGTCKASTFGHLQLNGKTADFTDAEFGKMILPALREGYILTIYPPTKSGIFINQECASAKATTP